MKLDQSPADSDERTSMDLVQPVNLTYVTNYGSEKTVQDQKARLFSSSPNHCTSYIQARSTPRQRGEESIPALGFATPLCTMDHVS